jgi:hypothetical protein
LGVPPIDEAYGPVIEAIVPIVYVLPDAAVPVGVVPVAALPPVAGALVVLAALELLELEDEEQPTTVSTAATDSAASCAIRRYLRLLAGLDDSVWDSDDVT